MRRDREVKADILPVREPFAQMQKDFNGRAVGFHKGGQFCIGIRHIIAISRNGAARENEAAWQRRRDLFGKAHGQPSAL
ncbi:hypothetical protein [Rhizobium terrae]|uniref:hypothetical protein n=1 Tax=Rhizobium terrae TaxID=2171756 RepID=UPI000E3C0FBE|nr:hypothetical protein [Rhizobium terrae]